MTKAKQKDMLELFSFELNEDMFLDEQIYYVELPESWREFIKSKRIKWDEFELSIKPKNLARKLQTLFPSIFYLHWFSSPWFIADEKMNLELLKEICLRRSEEHTSELQSRGHLVCRLLLEKKKEKKNNTVLDMIVAET